MAPATHRHGFTIGDKPQIIYRTKSRDIATELRPSPSCFTLNLLTSLSSSFLYYLRTVCTIPVRSLSVKEWEWRKTRSSRSRRLPTPSTLYPPFAPQGGYNMCTRPKCQTRNPGDVRITGIARIGDCRPSAQNSSYNNDKNDHHASCSSTFTEPKALCTHHSGL